MLTILLLPGNHTLTHIQGSSLRTDTAGDWPYRLMDMSEVKVVAIMMLALVFVVLLCERGLTTQSDVREPVKNVLADFVR